MQSVRQREELELMGRQGQRPNDATARRKSSGDHCQPGHNREACINCQRHSFEDRERRYSWVASKKRGIRSVFQESESSLRQKLGLDKFSLFDESRRNTMVDFEWNGHNSGPSPIPRRSPRLEPRGSCSTQGFLTVDYRGRPPRSPQRQRRRSSGGSKSRRSSPFSSRSDIDIETSFSEISDDVSCASCCKDDQSSHMDSFCKNPAKRVSSTDTVSTLITDQPSEITVRSPTPLLEDPEVPEAESAEGFPPRVEVIPASICPQDLTVDTALPQDLSSYPDTVLDAFERPGSPYPCLPHITHGVRIHIEPSTPVDGEMWLDGFV